MKLLVATTPRIRKALFQSTKQRALPMRPRKRKFPMTAGWSRGAMG